MTSAVLTTLDGSFVIGMRLIQDDWINCTLSIVM